MRNMGSNSRGDPDATLLVSSRREFLALAAGLALGLVGCGGKDELGADASNAAYPRDVHHATGTAHLERQPQHIHVAVTSPSWTRCWRSESSQQASAHTRIGR